MGTCPHCRAVTLPGDAVCYSCGRFLKGEGSEYSMPNAPMRRGTVVANGRTKNIMRRRKNHQRSLFMLAFVVFAFLSPQAREAAFGSVEDLDGYIARLLQGSMIYPMEAEFTVVRSYDVENNLDREGMLIETVRLPVALPSVLLNPLEMDGSTPLMLQQPIAFAVTIGTER
ncbi:MAG: zinc ribbon domain-containing protein, partial [archaeon]|nr:zinc ribbon domain-containing protein [archaeon]